MASGGDKRDKGRIDWNSDVENQARENRKGKRRKKVNFLEAQIRRANGLPSNDEESESSSDNLGSNGVSQLNSRGGG